MKTNLDRDKVFIEHIINKKYKISKDGTILNLNTNKVVKNNCLKFTFSHDKKLYAINKSRAVWLAFNEPLKDNEVVYKHDSTLGIILSNLKVCTDKEFTQIKGDIRRKPIKPKQERKKRIYPPKPKKEAPKSANKLSVEQVIALRQECMENPNLFVIKDKAKLLGVNPITLSAALKGKGKIYSAIPDPIPTNITLKKGGNKKPKLWKRENCPSHKKNYKKIKPKILKPEKPIVPKNPINVVSFKPKVKNQVKPVFVMTEEEKAARLEMMKRIGKKLNNIKEH